MNEWMNEWMTSVFARSEALPATLTSPAQSSGIWGSGCVPTAMASHIRRLDLQLLFFKKSGFENGAKFWIHWGWSWKSDKTSVMGIEPPTVPQNVRVERIQFKPQTFAKMAKNSADAWFWQDKYVHCLFRTLKYAVKWNWRPFYGALGWMIKKLLIMCENIQLCLLSFYTVMSKTE